MEPYYPLTTFKISISRRVLFNRADDANNSGGNQRCLLLPHAELTISDWTILFKPFGLLGSKDLNYLTFQFVGYARI
jgi:hypothetical protein